MVDKYGKWVFYASRDHADRLVKSGRAKRVPGGQQYVLVESGVSDLPMRTHICGNADRGAIGRSQDYTLRHKGHVHDFKDIHPEDAYFLRLAVTDNTVERKAPAVEHKGYGRLACAGVGGAGFS